jgi:esterase
MIKCNMFFKKISYTNTTKPTKNFVLLHQLLGNHKTYQKFITYFEPLSNNFDMNFYLLDLRNHGFYFLLKKGDSPHLKSSLQNEMSKDFENFILEEGIQEPICIGNSLGARVIMLTALNNPEIISSVVSLDASPSNYKFDHEDIFNAIKSVKFEEINQKKEIISQLHKSLPDLSTCFWITGNLKEDNSNWKINFDSIYNDRKSFLSFEYEGIEKYFGKSLFIGAKNGKRMR